MNVAQLREAARNAEIKLQWELAADLYNQAVAAYTVRPGDNLGAFDRSNLERLAKSCERAAKRRQEEAA